MSQLTQICIDPSCFLSLNNQTDFLKILDVVSQESPHSIQVVVPTELYDVIMKKPEEKFKELENLLSDWSDEEEKYHVYESEKNLFVSNTRYFLEKYHPLPAKEFTSNLDKVGSESIFKKDVLEKLGEKTGRIIFDLMGFSWKTGGKILSLGKKTFSFMKKVGVTIKEGHSKYKQEIRDRSGARVLLRICQFVTGMAVVKQFFDGFQMNEIPINPSELILGVLLVADG